MNHPNLKLTVSSVDLDCNILDNFKSQGLYIVAFYDELLLKDGVILEGIINDHRTIRLENVISFIPVNGWYFNSLLICDYDNLEKISIEIKNEYPFQI